MAVLFHVSHAYIFRGDHDGYVGPTDVTLKLMVPVVDDHRTKPLENRCSFSDPGA